MSAVGTDPRGRSVYSTSIARAVSLHPQTEPPRLSAARDLVKIAMLHIRQTMGSNLGSDPGFVTEPTEIPPGNFCASPVSRIRLLPSPPSK